MDDDAETKAKLLNESIPKLRAMRDRYPAEALAVHRIYNMALFRLESLVFEQSEFAAMVLLFIGLGITSRATLESMCYWGRRNRAKQLVDEVLKGLMTAGYIEAAMTSSTSGRPLQFFRFTDKAEQWWARASISEFLRAALMAAKDMPIDLPPIETEEILSPATKVYLFHKRGTTLYKIGISGDVPGRLKALNAGHEKRLYCAASMDGDFALERYMHEINGRFRSVWGKRTEWFRFKSHERAVATFLQKEAYSE